MDPAVRGLGAGEAVKHQMGGKVGLTYTGAVWSGRALLEVEQRWLWLAQKYSLQGTQPSKVLKATMMAG
jgi:hypothetical protein